MRLMIERALNNYILHIYIYIYLSDTFLKIKVQPSAFMNYIQVYVWLTETREFTQPIGCPSGEEQDCKSSGNAPMIGQFFCHHRSHLQAVSALGPNLHYDDELDKNNCSRKFPRWFETKVMHLKDHVERPEKKSKTCSNARGSSNYENFNLGTISSRLTF